MTLTRTITTLAVDNTTYDALDVTTPDNELIGHINDMINGVASVEQFRFDQISTPTTPASGKNRLYFKSGNGLYRLDSSGNEKLVNAFEINTARASLGSAAASVSISSIPSTFKHLLLLLEMRTDAAANFDNILLRFNSDSTVTNYYSQYGFHANTSWTTAENLGATYGACFLGSIAAGNTAPANTNGFAAVWIPNYASASLQRMITYQGGARGAATSGTLRASMGAGWWLNAAAAISTITILPQAGTNLAANSAYTLYGVN